MVELFRSIVSNWLSVEKLTLSLSDTDWGHFLILYGSSMKCVCVCTSFYLSIEVKGKPFGWNQSWKRQLHIITVAWIIWWRYVIKTERPFKMYECIDWLCYMKWGWPLEQSHQFNNALKRHRRLTHSKMFFILIPNETLWKSVGVTC